MRKFWIFFSVLLTLAVFPLFVWADDNDYCGAGGVGEATAEEYVSGPKGLYALEQPFGNRSSIANIGEYIQLVYSYAAGLIGIIAVVLIMAGGMMWITAAGNEQKISTAKEVIVSAVTAVLIIVLSYGILLFINPRLLDVVVQVPEIPVTSCPGGDPELTSIPAHANLTGSGQLCPGAAAALTLIADNMALTCPTCKIGIGSTFRSPESQEPLYKCYKACVDEGYIDSSGTNRKKSGYPSGCSSCNKAAKPCCSNHQKGIAADVWLEGLPTSLGAETSAGKLQQSYNNGGGDAELAKNQVKLKEFMEATINGKQLFKGISIEWWHFDYKGDCGSAGQCAARTTADGFSTPADNTYCQATKSDGTILYRHANCNAGKPECIQGYGGYTWNTITDGSCGSQTVSGATYSSTFYSFVGKTAATTPSQTYLQAPACSTASTSGGATCPFIAVQSVTGEYLVDNNILPQSEDVIGNEVVTDLYPLQQTVLLNEGRYNLQLREWEQEKSFFDQVRLWRLPKQNDLYYAVTPKNEIVAYSPAEKLDQCILNRGVDCTSAIEVKDEMVVPGIPGDSLQTRFVSAESYSTMGLLISAQGRDRVTIDIQPRGALSTTADKIANFIVPSANAKQSLHVYIKDASDAWQKISELHPRERTANFELYDLSQLPDLPKTLEVKVAWTGYHSIDVVQLVNLTALPEKPTLLPLSNAQHSSGLDVTQQLQTKDSAEATLVPGEQIDLEFSESDPTINPEDYEYFFESTGYYYTLK